MGSGSKAFLRICPEVEDWNSLGKRGYLSLVGAFSGVPRCRVLGRQRYMTDAHMFSTLKRLGLVELVEQSE